MTPEQRLDRTERILMLMIRAGRRARTEWNEKVNILIDAQIKNEEGFRELRELFRKTEHKSEEADLRWQQNSFVRLASCSVKATRS